MSEIEKKPRPRPEWGFFSGTAIGALGLCERRRAGFARLSGWQPVGNWVASAANFPASLLPVGFNPKRAEESRPAVCPEKWPEAQAERGYVQSGGFCVPKSGGTAREAVPRPRGSQCPSGWTASGGACERLR